jgi:hypothetical protein
MKHFIPQESRQDSPQPALAAFFFSLDVVLKIFLPKKLK